MARLDRLAYLSRQGAKPLSVLSLYNSQLSKPILTNRISIHQQTNN
jgi:hypothetical protein